MARISNIEIKQEPKHYTLTIRKTIDFMKDYSDFAEQVLALTGSYLSELGVYPISGPVVCFHNQELETLDVEMGWQIAEIIEDKDDMICRLIESRKVVSAIDLGPYESQDPTLMDLFEWMKENGHEPQGPISYCYLNDTQRPEAEYLTQMSIPIS
ncbi:GyrI-like domain-containing protein [Ruminococcaceae bacterium OttesenSCG-928-N02]|nr:GyrI-like domain-containing protein [Ruminococcaceae bacterium OttesenSCG-928-N02]